jgi:hypothetical protein
MRLAGGRIVRPWSIGRVAFGRPAQASLQWRYNDVGMVLPRDHWHLSLCPWPPLRPRDAWLDCVGPARPLVARLISGENPAAAASEPFSRPASRGGI